jgi:hypothetical protein
VRKNVFTESTKERGLYLGVPRWPLRPKPPIPKVAVPVSALAPGVEPRSFRNATLKEDTRIHTIEPLHYAAYTLQIGGFDNS